MAGGIHKYTSSEAQNVGLGQLGSMLIDTTSVAKTPPGGQMIVAITMLEDSAFSALVQENAATHLGTTAVTYGYTLDGSNTIPSGVTIFGRWSSATLSAGSVICYFGV